MKNKYFLFAVFVGCMAGLFFLKPVKVIAAPVAEKTDLEICCFTDTDKSAAILCEPTTVNFSARTVTVSCHDNAKNHERLFKNKLSLKKNFRIELSVENYIFFTESLTYYHSNLTKLRRLNI